MAHMRILYLNGRSDVGGGPEIAYRLLAGLDRSRFRLFVACPDEAPYAARLAELPELTMFPLALRRLRPTHLMHLARIVREQRIECVHSHGKAAGLWSRVLRLLFPRLVVVHTYHGLHYRQYPRALRALYLRVEALMSRLTTRVVHVSASEQREAQRLRLSPRAKQTVIANGVALPRTRPSREEARRRLGLTLAGPALVTVARYSYQKNLARAFAVTARLAQRGIEARLIVVGGPDDQSRAEIETQMRAAHVEDRVDLVGERDDVPVWLCAADVYVSTSRWEGLPTSVLEAMAVGLPVVATRVAGNDEAVTAQTGVLVDEHDVDGFAEAVERFLEDAALRARCAEAARARVAEDFSLERMVDAHARLYTELLR